MTPTQLREEFSNTMARIPRFIDTTSSLDHAVWNNMRYISDVLLQLVSTKILKEGVIMTIMEHFEIELEMISDVSDKVTSIQIYFNALLDHMLVRSIEEEAFEAATNIRNYVTTYKNRYQF